jgi:SAM-dependent methyltransferase
VYWDKSYLAHDSSEGYTDASRSIERFLRDVPEGARVLDLGCGDGRWSVELAKAGRRVTAVDYSYEALRLAGEHDTDSLVDFRYLNVNDRAALYEFGAWMLATGEEWYVFAHYTVQSLTKVNRSGLFRFFELVLRGDGFAELVNDTMLNPFYERGRPSTWHLPVEWLQEELAPRLLDAEVRDVDTRRERGKRLPTATVRITRKPGLLTDEREFAAAEREDGES